METTRRSEKCGFRWQDAKHNHWCEKTGSHAEHECWACGSTPPAATAPIVCPECAAGKHTSCAHFGFDEHDEETDCQCGCETSRTCPSCGDTVPSGWTLEDHLNCNHPEDFA